MTPVFAARRRAEEFASLVDAPSTGRSGDPRYDDLLRLVGSLRETIPVTARPEFVAGLRERLLTAADTALVPAAGDATRLRTETERLTLPPRRSARERRIAAAVGGLALVGATTSVAMAAQDALPGEALYPVKRAVENARTGLQIHEGDKGVTLLATASGRLDEVSALSEQNDGSDTLAIADTLDVFADQATEASELLLADYAEGGDPSSITELRDFTSVSLDQLAALEPDVPDAARDELVRAAQLLVEIDAAAQQACPLCAGLGITEVPRIFAPTAATFTVPHPIAATTPTSDKARDGAKGHKEGRAGESPAVPSADPGTLPSGSVASPSPAPVAGGGQQQPQQPQPQPAQQDDDPVGDLTGDLIDKLKGGGSTGTTSPATPDLGETTDEVVEDVDEAVDGLVDGVDPITGKVLP